MAGAWFIVDRASTGWPGLPLEVGQAWEVHPGCFPTLGCATRDWELKVLPAFCPLPAPAGNELTQLQWPHCPITEVLLECGLADTCECQF